MCDILGHRIFTLPSYCQWSLGSCEERGLTTGRLEKLRYCFPKKGNAGLHKAETTGYDYWTDSRRWEYLVKCRLPEAIWMHLLTVSFPSRILLSVLDKDVGRRVWTSGRIRSFIHI